MTKASNEFMIGISGAEGSKQYTAARAMTFNGKAGHLWTKRVVQDRDLVLVGQLFVRAGASESEVMEAFEPINADGDLDFDKF